jgi:putative inorganic carbon (HCO3(-)) transporter
LALIAFLPFFGVIDLSFNLLNFGIGVVAFAYLSKLIRGKRVFRFSLIDTMMLFLILAVWFSGVASAGGEVSLQKARHACLLMLMYFMIVNLIRTPKWLHRATLALIGASVILAFIGIFQYASEMKALASTDDFTAPWMIAQASSVFETSHAFGTYLMITIPLCMSVLITASGSKKRILAVLCFMIMIAAVVVTWSRGAWLGVLISLLIFFLIYSRKTACWLLIGGLTVPVWYSFLPSSFLSHFTDVLNLSDPAVYRQIYTWRGTLRMISNHLLGGIGYGTEAFCEVYPNYSIPGLELSESAGSLYLTIWSVMGLFGLLVFFAVMIVFAQHCFEYIGNASEPYSRTLVAAGFAGIMGTLIIGIGSDVWYHETVFMACVTVMALTCAYIRVGTLIRERNQDVSGSDFSHAHVDLHFEN